MAIAWWRKQGVSIMHALERSTDIFLLQFNFLATAITLYAWRHFDRLAYTVLFCLNKSIIIILMGFQHLISWIIDPRNRAYKVGAITFVVSSAWPISMLLSVRPVYHAFRWIENAFTFSVIHHSSFSVATGVFAAAIDLSILKNLQRSRRLLLLALLIVMLGVANWIVLEDFFGKSHLEPYELVDSTKAVKNEWKLRQNYEAIKKNGRDPAANAEYKKQVTDYKKQFLHNLNWSLGNMTKDSTY